MPIPPPHRCCASKWESKAKQHTKRSYIMGAKCNVRLRSGRSFHPEFRVSLFCCPATETTSAPSFTTSLSLSLAQLVVVVRTTRKPHHGSRLTPPAQCRFACPSPLSLCFDCGACARCRHVLICLFARTSPPQNNEQHTDDNNATRSVDAMSLSSNQEVCNCNTFLRSTTNETTH